MHQVQGIGLAAQQVGKAIRFCVVDVPDHPDYPIACILDGKPLSPSLLMPMSLANPQVTALPSDEYYYEEGCLSFPRNPWGCGPPGKDTRSLSGPRWCPTRT